MTESSRASSVASSVSESNLLRVISDENDSYSITERLDEEPAPVFEQNSIESEGNKDEKTEDSYRNNIYLGSWLKEGRAAMTNEEDVSAYPTI